MGALADRIPNTRQGVAILKGTLAYCLTFILIFIHPFARLNDYPVTLTGAVLIAIAGQPGLSVGACWDQAFWAAMGVGVGGGCFAILAKLGHSQVAQGFVFAVMVYFLALIKAQSLRYFGFSLLAIILAFSGIYTSILSGGRFVPEYLEAYLESYLWGFAIVLAVNLVVLPHSSEKELRELMVVSVEHISLFAHLIAKTYALDISDEEKEVRDQLNTSIRADMGLLNQRLGTVALEINYSKWSMTDYSIALGHIRQIQQGLITSYSSLIAMERYDPKALDVIKQELQDTNAKTSFQRLRKAADLAFSDLVQELGVGGLEYHSPAPGERSWDDFVDDRPDADLEAAGEKSPLTRVTSRQQRQQAKETHGRFALLRDRLRKEVATAGPTPTVSRRPSFSAPETVYNPPKDAATPPAELHEALATTAAGKSKSGVIFLRRTWKQFKDGQLAAVRQLLTTSPAEDTDRELRLHTRGLTLAEQYLQSTDRFRFQPSSAGTQAAKTTATETSHSTASKRVSEKDSQEDVSSVPPSESSSDRADAQTGTAVMRIFAFISGMDKVADELAKLHEHIVPNPDQPLRKKRLRFHAFERKGLQPPKKEADEAMSVRQAIAKLSGRDFVPKPRNFWRTIAELERLVRTDTSIYALKTAAAVSVYAVFLLAPSLSSFFINYGLTAGIITLVVAMAPSLGQTLITFVIQILGTGVGALLGLLILRISLNVGGFVFNPYVVVCLLILVGIGGSSIIYCRPVFFAGALLLMNAAGVLIITEWIYNEQPGQIRPGFDSPAFRCAKQIVAMCIALAIAGIFQAFILRTPARSALRVKLANICWMLSAQAVLFGYYTEALMPMAGSSTAATPDEKALAVVRDELVARETHIQGELLGLMPLMKFAAVEPTFGSPFKAPTISRVIRAHQLILDRLRESRQAIGSDGFNPAIRREFADVLTPYRKHGKRVSRALFFLTATSLSTKQPLPADLPSMVSVSRNIQSDAWLLSKRLSMTDAGRELLATDDFLRYWFYIVAYSSISYLLEGLEPELRELFGNVEDSPFVEDAKAEVQF
ncbi:hypothetical protein JCM10207_000685 [Rhodosporidiobolus poonsookiae]